MAIFETPKQDGIQLGKRLDRCFKCAKIKASQGSAQPVDTLEYQEIFKLHVNGIEYVACMDHFQEMLGDYVLVHKDSLTEKDVLTIDAEDTVEEIEKKAKATKK